MGIDSQHPLYAANLERWKRCRDVYEGEDAVKLQAGKYLPRPSGLDDGEYKAYVHRALFYNATGRTIDGFVGAIARKDPTYEVPAQIQPVIDKSTADGLSLSELIKRICAEIILQGRGGILVDFNDAEQAAFMTLYPAEAITNWADDSVVLHETVYEPDPDVTFGVIEVEQFRQLLMVDGVYTVTTWRKNLDVNKPEAWIIYGPVLTPTRRGQTINTMPFYWLSSLGKTSRIDKPPLLDLVSVSLSHYRNSADLEHGRHFTGLPTFYCTGISDTDKPIMVGSLAAIQIADANAKVGYAEFSGQGLKSLEVALETKEHMMAVLGASVFNDGPKGVEAAETAKIRTSGETSLLSGVVTAVEETLKDALQRCAEWMSVSGTVEITLNREFIDTTMDGPTLTGLVQAFQAGALSIPQFLWNLQQGDLLAPDTDLDEEAVQVATEAAQRLKDAVTLAQSKGPPKGGAA